MIDSETMEIIKNLEAELVLMRCCGNCKYQNAQAVRSNCLICLHCIGKRNWKWTNDNA